MCRNKKCDIREVFIAPGRLSLISHETSRKAECWQVPRATWDMLAFLYPGSWVTVTASFCSHIFFLT